MRENPILFPPQAKLQAPLGVIITCLSMPSFHENAIKNKTGPKQTKSKKEKEKRKRKRKTMCVFKEIKQSEIPCSDMRSTTAQM